MTFINVKLIVPISYWHNEILSRYLLFVKQVVNSGIPDVGSLIRVGYFVLLSDLQQREFQNHMNTKYVYK